MSKEEDREVCRNCKHTRRFHKKFDNQFINYKLKCSQPTCRCECFIPTGLIYTTDILNAYEQGLMKCVKDGLPVKETKI